MNRRAKLPGRAMPYFEAIRFSAALRDRAKNSALDPAYISLVGMWRRRFEEVLERAGVVAQHVAVAHAQAAVLDDDHAARFERLDGGVDRLGAAGHAEVRP